MRTIPDPDDRAAVLAALTSSNPGATQRYEVYIDGEPITDSVETIEPETEEGKLGVVVNCDLRGSFNWVQKRMRFDVELMTDGVRTKQFGGEVRRVKKPRGWTSITAVSPGFWNERIWLGEPKTYEEWPPDAVVWDAVSRNRAYDHAHTSIAPARIPIYDSEEGFREIDTVGSVLEAVIPQVFYVAFDNPLRGMTAKAYYGPAEVSRVEGVIPVGFATGFSEDEWDPEDTEEDYFDVLVYREEQTPSGGTRIRALSPRIPIPGSGAERGATYGVPLTEFEENTGSGLELAHRAAGRLRHRVHTQQAHLPFIHPLIEPGDAFELLEADDELGVGLVRHWIAVVKNHAPLWAEKRHRLDMELVVASEERLPVPVVGPITPAQASAPPMFTDHRGRFLMDTRLPFVEDLGTRVRIDRDLAEAMGFSMTDIDASTLRVVY